MKNKIVNRFSRITLILILMLSILMGCSQKSTVPVQMSEGSGQYVVRIHFSDGGSVDLRLFEKVAPNAVKSFISKAESGHYNACSVATVIEDFCVIINDSNNSEANASASNNAVAAAPQAIANFSDEINNDYYPFYGALCLSDDGTGIDASQFYIITAKADFLNELKQLLAYKNILPKEYYEVAYGTKLTDEELSLFDNYGGAPWLYGHCIVFGQIYSGFEELDKLAGLETEGDKDYTPLEKILIESIEIK